ncbi:MAG: bifunctional riboflavin kinase/FAD synthetase [Acholeplasmataceae bacterium]|nr:bifunctional riboflavin kinase/FAD synthetase [Acholeplasmataceae bacterium]
MKVYHDHYQNLKNTDSLTITIGNFDGVHIGHQGLINYVKSFKDTKSALLTFYPHPMKVLRNVEYQQISNLDQKVKFIKAFKLDYMFIATFDEDFSSLSSEDFINFLKELNVKRIIIGRDFRFGKYAKGTIQDLQKHFDVVIYEDVKRENIRISTTYIKDLIYSGDLEQAEIMLSRPYEITGKVIHGDGVGRTLGMPTANLDVNAYVLPKNGVYYVKVFYEDKIYGGALNIGYNPTINYSITKRVEVHILDFNEDIYDKELTLQFIKYLRPEYQFKSKELLMIQLAKDIQNSKALFEEDN